MAVGADIRFEVSAPGRSTVRGTLRGHDDHLVLDVDDPAAFAGSRDGATSRATAEVLARRGVLVTVVSKGVHLVSVGAVSAPRWQQWATGSPRIRLGSPRGAWTALRARLRSSAPLLPELHEIPATLFPVAPTMKRPPPRGRQAVTTTHDVARGGSPKLIMVLGSTSWAGEQQSMFELLDPVTTIGSDESCDIVLPGLRGRHAEVFHDGDDEFVLVASDDGVVVSDPDVRVNGVDGFKLLLRTGSTVQIRDHVLSFVRDEFADHGRPYGGRLGGEWGYQRSQPPRPDGPPGLEPS